MLVKDYLGKKRLAKGHIGLELEVELETPAPSLDTELWLSKEDRSLRGEYSIEYVSPKPLEMDQAQKAIRQIGWELGQKKHKVRTSPRTSFHVHINVLDLNLVQYWTFVTSYWLLEELLFNFIDPYRKGNCFCLRLSDAEAVLRNVKQDLSGSSPFGSIRSDNIRYAALNLYATYQHGSLEFRGMDGKVDTTRMDLWVAALYNLKLRSQNFKSPSDLLDQYFKEDANTFLAKLLDKEILGKILIGSWRDQLLKSAGTVLEIGYFHDWDKWKTKMETSWKKPAKNSFEEEMPQVRATTIGAQGATRQFMNTLIQRAQRG